MVTNGSKAGAPHELNVWRFVESRSSELKSLHSIVADRLDNDFKSQRNKRRRTTGHDDRVSRKRFRKRRKIGVEDMHKTDSEQKEEKTKISRRARRNIELKKNTQSEFGTSGDGTKRLRTHVWHAKRFTMKKLWGFYIPLGLHGRGRGSRALLKKLKNGVLVHDASYCGSVQLEGAEETLMSVLSSVLVPSPSACSKEASHDILAGNIFGTAMLHHGGKSYFPPIAPVTYMWRPPNGDQNNGYGTMTHQLLVWIHGAALQEAYDALSSACERQTDTTRSVQCVSREGQLAKLELIGSKVFQLLQKTLLPATRNTEDSWPLKKCLADKESEKISILENGDHISSSAIVSLVVRDPRTLTRKENAIVPEGKSLGIFSSNEECRIREQNEAECVNECSDLWDISKGVYPPVEESVLCMEKHYQRKEFVRVGHRNSGPHDASVDGKYSKVCPVLLLNDEKIEDSVARCSIILPLSWVKAFWITFISNGAQAIGLREKHWVASNIGLPYFPLDFPDCNAYSHYMEMEVSEINSKTSLLPPSKIPVELPIPPPWNCVHFTLEKRFSKDGSTQTKAEKNGDQDGKNNDSCCGKSHARISSCHGAPYKGVIARTGCMLRDFLNSISGDHLLLFPRVPDQKSCLHKSMREEAFLKQDTVISEVMNCGKTLCYTRVLLRACKEGVFEQGAVVCAPHVADITSWKASAESDELRLQIPQSSLKSYFIQLPSGEWEPQIPEDEALGGSHRWPIGFVTTGFVRGSKKAMAGALCEASLLSGLREEQWKALPVKQRRKEIYVLVRNLRSTAYRLAIVTIVLELQEQDVKFM